MASQNRRREGEKKKKVDVHCLAPPGDLDRGKSIERHANPKSWMNLIELDRPLCVCVWIGLSDSLAASPSFIPKIFSGLEQT